MSEHAFKQIDVFSDEPLKGNPLAVVFQADGLSEAQMAAFARWTNLSETTFLLKPTTPEADYRVRIFTPGGELMFAGHPTLGSCHAWLQGGGQPRQPECVVQECGVGLVRVRRDGTRLAFAAPPLKLQPVSADELATAIAALGLAREQVREARWLDMGTRWLGLLLVSADEALAAKPRSGAMRDFAKVGLIGPYPEGSPCQYEVRGFAEPIGVPEDPVTGSLNAGLARWLIDAGIAPSRYVAAQGQALGRAGRVHVERIGADIWIGGHSVTRIEGRLSL